MHIHIHIHIHSPLYVHIQDRVRINLVFELIDADLKKYMDAHKERLPQNLVQVWCMVYALCLTDI